MKPTAWVLMHPTRSAATELIMSLRRVAPRACRCLLADTIEAIHSAGDGKYMCGGKFASYMVAMWSVMVNCPSWKHSVLMDECPELIESAKAMRAVLESKIEAREEVALMADPVMVERLIELGYTIRFFYSDTLHMTNEQLMECYPNRYDGVVGSWLAHRFTPEHYGHISRAEAIA
jgi:hypothetical protein